MPSLIHAWDPDTMNKGGAIIRGWALGPMGLSLAIHYITLFPLTYDLDSDTP